MSFGCSWEPVAPPPPDNDLPTGFKYAVAPRWFGHDGTLRGEQFLDRGDISYLQGLMDAHREGHDVHEGAKALIAAIQKYGEVIFHIGAGE